MRLPDRLNLGALVGWQGATDNPALVHAGRAISLRALESDTCAVARALRRFGIGTNGRPSDGRAMGAGARIAIVCGNRPEFIAIMFGAMRAGCTVVPINPRQPIAVTRAVLDEAQPMMVFVERSFRHTLPATVRCVTIEALDAELIDAANAVPSLDETNEQLDFSAAVPVGPDDLAEILYTSGSTGQPRGVPLTHRGQIWFLNTFLDATGWSPEVALVAAPLFHMNALIRVKCALATGGRIVLQDGFSPDAYLQAIEMHGVTLLTGVPTMYAILLERRDLLRRVDTRSVTRLMLGSGAAPADLVDALRSVFPRATIGVAYGLTEAGGTVSSTLVRTTGPAPRGSVGRALPGIELRFGEAGAEQGVLYLRSPAASREYFQRPEPSVDRFQDGWLKTNDILRRDADGWLYFLGRADDMFVCGGENVYPAQVEARLLNHPHVAQAVVVPAPDRIKGQVAFAFVVLRAAGSASARDLQAHAASGAPSHLHPYRVHLLEAMPLSGTNKVDLVRLRQMALELSPQRRPHADSAQ
jgi:acyl-CoA synthetase (AMP-forming)/AMP-acid ligase II